MGRASTIFRALALVAASLAGDAAKEPLCGGSSTEAATCQHTVRGFNLMQLQTAQKVFLPDMNLSVRDSLGFMAELDDLWKERRRIHKQQMTREAAHSHLKDHTTRGGAWWQTHYEPSFHCDLEERLGLMGDGGKWVCNPSTITKQVVAGAPCLVYSVGSNGDFSFEKAVMTKISPKCEVHVFDPAPEGKWTPPANVYYHSTSLGDGQTGQTLKQIVTQLGHAGRRIDLFKIDCEGCEWTTYQNWLNAGVELHQILVEMHWASHGSIQRVHGLFGHLSKEGYVIFNKEPNTLGCRGECIEYAFLKMDPSFNVAD